MTTPLFPSVIGWNLLDGGTDAQDGNAFPGPNLQDYAATVVGASGIPFRQALRAGSSQAVSVRNPLAITSLSEPVEILTRLLLLLVECWVLCMVLAECPRSGLLWCMDGLGSTLRNFLRSQDKPFI